ncbi:AraC family transcriptional regulator [Chitinophaga filiformis]|uniref:AraC family transcriptional regulator n=1 Tax=Chitinophaga filiformis TaxID=104663 RepID=A0ABY4HVU3_CHIFI|nr:AraC family transcriptional regulator [Chitinophaga filiformis]UPK67909.1 AraC family transcriptional regulator [Chitinophaga filiformis]
MKVLQFTIPVPLDKSIIVQKDVLPYFYPHLHRHQEIQLTWIQQGEGTLVADNNMHAFRPNEIYWLGANQPHIFKSEASYFQPKSRKKIVALVIFFNPDGELAGFFNLPEIKVLKNFIQQHQSGFKVPQEHATEISSRMLKVTNSSGTEQLLQFVELLKQLSTYQDIAPLASGQKTQHVSEHEGIRIGHIYNYIMHNYDQPITLEDAAKQAHMTPQAFCRFFKKHTLHTFVSFLNEVRINEACKKLTDGSYDNIATVAYTCGFNSITNFNRVFKTVTNKSPSEYMNSYFQSV